MNSKTFKNFLEYTEKQDNSCQYKFSKLCDNFKTSENPFSGPIYELNITEKLTVKELYKYLEKFYLNLSKDTALNKYIILTAFKLLKESYFKIESYNETLKSSKDIKEFSDLLENNYFHQLTFNMPNIFFGDFCVIQLIKGLITPLNRKFFRILSTEPNIYQNNSENIPEVQALVLLYLLKPSSKEWDNPTILTCAMKLEDVNQSLIPKYQIAEIIEKEQKVDKTGLERLIDKSQLLKKMSDTIYNTQSISIKEGLPDLVLGKKNSKKKTISSRSIESKHSPSADGE